MRHPYAYPEVFVSIFLSLDLDVSVLTQCSTVCRSWRDFIHGYLWNSERVKVRVEYYINNNIIIDCSSCVMVLTYFVHSKYISEPN